MSIGSPFVVGIDLGTTNSAVAYIDLRQESEEFPPVRVFSIPQLVGPGRVESRPLLPSFVYLPGAFELPPGALALPWDPSRAYAVGELARLQGSSVPGRLVSSSKSWLCHGGVDRRASILPWAAADDVHKISPVDASARLLRHIREAWDHEMARGDETLRLERQEVILTVPASFDEVARELTCEAAAVAGLGPFTLLEEPQAAFYCWIREHEGRWETALPSGGTILVCDIGGGTTDLSLIRATPAPVGGPPSFERVAVGAHLLLGGDNMDLTLARYLEAETARVGTLAPRQWAQLAHRCREAKEVLLTADGPTAVTVVVPGATSRVIGGAVSKELDVDTADRVLLDGFFPKVAREDISKRPKRSGIHEFGLPFEGDPSVPRHVLTFLHAQAQNVDAESQEDGLVRPDAILFNGGATQAVKVQRRIVGNVADWFPRRRASVPGWAPSVLDNRRPDLAVALGAAYYGAVRRGLGVRIRGGSARAFYVGVDVGASQKSTEQKGAEHVLCVIPHGLEEGKEVTVERILELATNQPVRFPLWSSSTRLHDVPGQVIDRVVAELEPLPPIHTTLQYGKKTAHARLPVQVVARVTEIGTLALQLASAQTQHRWKLEFDLRAGRVDDPMGGATAVDVLDEESISRAREVIEDVFSRGALSPQRLVREIESQWGQERDDWSPAALRALWPAIRDAASHRVRGAEYEARWLNLAGFALRPGRGLPGDELRVRELWSTLYGGGIQHRNSGQVWREWWVMWRRVAAGLTEGQQTQLFGTISPLILSKKVDTFKAGRPAPDAAETQELWLAAASLERLPAASRVKLGDVAMKFLSSKSFDRFGVWVLARLGARVPLYAGAHAALPPTVAERWLSFLMTERWQAAADSLFDTLQIARLTGDRARDIAAPVREKLIALVGPAEGGESLTRFLEEVVELDSSETAHLLADTLPPGLALLPDAEA